MASVYVGTYQKYNNGSIQGAWVDLTKFKDEDEFLTHCKELHKDEEDPELMFQDFEEFPKAYYSESWLNSDLWEWLALDNNEKDILEAYLECFGYDGTIKDAMDAYYGQFENDEAMAWELLEGTGDLNEIPERIRFYFDMEKYARDLMISDFSESNGYYFMRN